jgi:FMN phosphatase YigB (HAD superfamily)
VSGGYAVVSETADDDAVLDLVGRLAAHAAAAGGRGAFNVQVLRRAQTAFVSDVNPRLGTSSTHWVGSGVNLLGHLLGHSRGAEAPALPSAGIRRRSLRRLQDDAVPVATGFESHEAAIGGVVFDLDDTLIPQKRWMLARLDAALVSLAPAQAPERDALLGVALRLIEEGRAASLFDDLAAACGLEPPALDALLAAYRRSAPPRCAVYDDVEAVLETLRRRGYRLGLLTDNPPESQERKLAASRLAERFDAVVFSRLHGGEKPAAAGFRAMEAALGLAAPRLAMVGNNPYRDAGGALRAGWGAAYLIRRAGSMCDFDHGLYSRTLPAAPRLRVLNQLTELLAHLVGLG